MFLHNVRKQEKTKQEDQAGVHPFEVEHQKYIDYLKTWRKVKFRESYFFAFGDGLCCALLAVWSYV